MCGLGFDNFRSIPNLKSDQSPELFRLEFLTLVLAVDFRTFKLRRERNDDEWIEKRFPNAIKQCPMIAQLIWYGKRDHFGKLQHPLTDLLRLVICNLEAIHDENWIVSSQ